MIPWTAHPRHSTGTTRGVEAQTNELVEIKGNSVILKCPMEKQISWFKKQLTGFESIDGASGQQYQIDNFGDHDNGEYYCSSSSINYNFYIRAKVCDDCIELGTGMVIGIICGDLAFTLGVAGLVYWFAKRRGPSAKDFRSLNPDDFPPSRPPMTSAHQAEYAPIKGGQREVYDKLQKR
ncbi:T-cell surface glycoprotein CD3 epsilon chain-like isoform X2 [Hypanus sabinus]|uniref:T-cell surface glycoprotein CD3 epsilon chain-like isoform X2 n=1 Tax=Hypanus sabinus TaxID=79690 RepID=UPI0028C5023F|nr:T-cell surface glycoprotein CD3 epsilon chain-like isoform X2 [Hypanus sabinus]